jgi:hypothetical protein
MSPTDLDSALAGALRPVPPVRLPEALLIGAAGSLGEAMMSGLLASSDYARIHVGVDRPMPSTSDRFSALLLDGTTPWPPARDAFLCETPPEAPVRDDAPIRPLSHPDMLAAARRARDAGARRLVLVAPLGALLQLSTTARTLGHRDEVELLSLGFETVLIVRPTRPEDANAARGLVPGLVRAAGRALAHIMLPTAIQPMRASTVAAAILTAAARVPPGVAVMSAREITAIVAESDPTAGRPRRRW